jgi:diguanylate cyclase (GGDEF)-like protein/PAS domain S-box-containing protein
MQLETINILVAEDNEHDFRQISRAFRKCDFSVNIMHCTRAEEALEIIATQEVKVDIFLTDYKMPGMTGLELAEQLHSQDATFPIIILTGAGDENIAVAALKLSGVFDYISKDVDSIFVNTLPDAVIKAIQNYSSLVELKEYQAKNKRLSLALEQSQSAITIVDLHENIIYVNSRCEQLSGYASEEVMSKNIVETFARATKDFNIKLMWDEVLQGKHQQCELKKDGKAGNSYWVTLSITAIKDDYAEISFVLVVEDCIDEQRKIQQLEDDIQYRIETEDQLRESKEKERKASEKLALKVEELGFQKSALDEHAIVSIADVQGNIIYVNHKFSEISQYSREELIGKNHRVLKSDLHPYVFFKNMWRTISQGNVWHGEVQNKAKDGSRYWLASTIVPMLNEYRKPKQYISINTDITDSKEQQTILETMAHYDILTQLPNRILLSDRFNQAIAHSIRSDTSMAICFLDLDNFKPINDTYGHEVGDALLIEVAERIKKTIRNEDTVSRHGGDEFIMLLGNVVNISGCEILLDRIIEALARPYMVGDQKISISASLGYTLYPLDDADFDTLVRHADHAMYQAKLAGRNMFIRFNAAEDEQNSQQLSELHAVEEAMEKKAFCLHYQPKVNMKTGELFGIEALIRWQRSKKELIYPLDFLPIISGSTIEVDLGNWVINEALQQLDNWKSQGCTLEVSVNISSFHILSATFIEDLGKTLAKYPDIEPQQLQLEILESSALGDINKINLIIKACQEILGIHIALDDFGTGYSSLAHLRNLTVNTIKVDQSFVRDMLDDPDDYAIIDGIIGLADSFNREVIAEGVETTELGLMLLNMGCDQAQGYCIAKPMPADEFLIWLKLYVPNQEWVEFGRQSLTIQESRKKLFRLVLHQWSSRIEKNLSTSPENLQQWPIMDSNKTSCAAWIKREKRTHLFEETWLNKLEKLNEEMMRCANELLRHYQAGKVEVVKKGIKNLQSIIKKIDKFLR